MAIEYVRVSHDVASRPSAPAPLSKLPPHLQREGTRFHDYPKYRAIRAVGLCLNERKYYVRMLFLRDAFFFRFHYSNVRRGCFYSVSATDTRDSLLLRPAFPLAPLPHLAATRPWTGSLKTGVTSLQPYATVTPVIVGALFSQWRHGGKPVETPTCCCATTKPVDRLTLWHRDGVLRHLVSLTSSWPLH